MYCSLYVPLQLHSYGCRCFSQPSFFHLRRCFQLPLSRFLFSISFRISSFHTLLSANLFSTIEGIQSEIWRSQRCVFIVRMWPYPFNNFHAIEGTWHIQGISYVIRFVNIFIVHIWLLNLLWTRYYRHLIYLWYISLALLFVLRSRVQNYVYLLYCLKTQYLKFCVSMKVIYLKSHELKNVKDCKNSFVLILKITCTFT